MSEKSKFILKVVEIAVGAAVGVGSMITTLKAAAMSDQDKTDIAERTAEILLEKIQVKDADE